MLINYLVLIAIISALALMWRALLMDHPKLLVAIANTPLVGSPLTCGFCSALWFSLVGILIYNPIAPLFELTWILVIFFSWLVVSVGVLFVRNLIALLIEATGVLSDMHQKVHRDELK